MTVKSLPYCASQMDKQKNTIILQPNHHWHLYCLRGRGTTCSHIASGSIHSSIKYLLACPLPPGTVPDGAGLGGVKVEVWGKKDEFSLDPKSSRSLQTREQDTLSSRESSFCPLAKPFSHWLLFIC